MNSDGELDISVIIPTYQDEEYAKQAIESVDNQTYKAQEIVIVDSSGVDSLAALDEQRPDITYVYQEPRGISAARNAGIEAASGDVIAWLDADDRWLPNKLEKQVVALQNGADIVYTDIYVVDAAGRRQQSSLQVTDPSTHHLKFLKEGGVPFSSVAMRCSALGDSRFDEDLTTAEDRHLLARLFRNHEPARVPEPLVEYRRRSGSLTDDFETLYRDELAVLADLADRYPDVQDCHSRLRAKAKYKYGKRLLRASQGTRARQLLWTAITEGYLDVRAVLLLTVSLLPAGHGRTLRVLERAQERLG